MYFLKSVMNYPMTIQVSRKPVKRPVCCSRKIASYFYGMPIFSEKLQKELKDGKIVPGGCCVILPFNPKWVCLACQTDFTRIRISDSKQLNGRSFPLRSPDVPDNILINRIETLPRDFGVSINERILQIRSHPRTLAPGLWLETAGPLKALEPSSYLPCMAHNK